MFACVDTQLVCSKLTGGKIYSLQISFHRTVGMGVSSLLLMLYSMALQDSI